MTVYVTQDPPPGISILAAREYGELVIVLPIKLPMFDTRSIISMAKKKLITYSDNDYILPMGDPSVIGLVAAIAAQNNKGKVTFIKWDRLERQYFLWPTQI